MPIGWSIFTANVKFAVIYHHVCKDLCDVTGLGFPLAMFTTNCLEAINSVLKKQVNYKKTQWPEFVQLMKQLVHAQRNEITHSLSGRDNYRIAMNFQFLDVSMDEWSKMCSDQ